MFEKLKRAKSFVVRTKTREELDLSESSHLRRNVVINSAAINRQRQLTAAQRPKQPKPKGKLDRQVSASHERIYDDKAILEQIRRINFGDARSSARREVVECYNKDNVSEGKLSGERNRDRDGRAMRTSEQRPRMERLVKK